MDYKEGFSKERALQDLTSKMSNPIKQHYIPKTYLKWFSINPNDNQHKSMVWHGWQSDHGPWVERVSIKSDKFKVEDFYTVLEYEEDPYLIEKTFSTEIEPLYSKIISEIQKEGNISIECRSNIIIWLYYSKCRNIRYRKHVRDFVSWYQYTAHAMKYGKEAADAQKKKFETEALSMARQIQIQQFADEKILEDFDRGLGSKEWFIWKCRKGKEFITTDDPGFSINMDIGDPQNLNGLFAGNAAASNFFPLSSRYCLEITPFRMGTPVEVNISNQIIPVDVANTALIDFINSCSMKTRNKYIIGSDKEVISKLLGK